MIFNNNNFWTIDSGASVHITYHDNLLKNKIPHKEELFFANGQKIVSTHKGDIEGYYNLMVRKLYQHIK